MPEQGDIEFQSAAGSRASSRGNRRMASTTSKNSKSALLEHDNEMLISFDESQEDVNFVLTVSTTSCSTNL